MAKSGYDAVYEQLFRISAVRGIYDEAIALYKAQTYVKSVYTPTVSYDYRTGKNRTSFNVTNTFLVGEKEINVDGNYVKFRVILDSDKITQEALNHFGSDKTVKTRNCKPGVIRGSESRKGVQSFDSWIRSKVIDELRTFTDEMDARHETLIREFGQGEAAKAAKAEGVGEFLKGKLLEHLKPWAEYDMRGEISMDDILHNAWLLVKAEVIIDL